jgi:glyoxylase I family protein
MALDIQGMVPLLQVFDMPTSITFYCEVLGFEVVMNDGKPVPHNDWVMLQRGETQLMLNTAYESDQRPPSPDRIRTAAHQDVGLFFGCPDVDAAYTYLRENKVAAREPKVAPYGMKQMYVTDPDGYELCFQCPAK